MYRKSVDYTLTPQVHILDFSSFKRKNQPGPELILDEDNPSEFRISRGPNVFLTIMVIADLLNDNKSHTKKKGTKVFQDFSIQNVPKSQFGYHHENTLQQLWTLLSSRAKSLKSIQELLMNYTVSQFVVQCYARKVIRDHISLNNTPASPLNLRGNQTELLSDYSCDLRGTLLSFLASALKIELTIKHVDGSADETYNQYYGDSNSCLRVQTSSDQQHIRVSLLNVTEISKLISTQSSQSILPVRKKQPESLDTTIENPMSRPPESKSANKEPSKCPKCRGKICECDKNKKAIAPRSAVSNNVQPRSLLDGIAPMGAYRRQSNQEVLKRGCECGRAVCNCKR